MTDNREDVWEELGWVAAKFEAPWLEPSQKKMFRAYNRGRELEARVKSLEEALEHVSQFVCPNSLCPGCWKCNPLQEALKGAKHD